MPVPPLRLKLRRLYPHILVLDCCRCGRPLCFDLVLVEQRGPRAYHQIVAEPSCNGEYMTSFGMVEQSFTCLCESSTVTQRAVQCIQS